MKKNYFFIICLIASFTINAQNNINFDASSTAGTGWLGFMNVFETPANGGAYVFGSSWGVADLVTELDLGANTATLKPNRVNDPDPFWTNAGVAEGNKVMDASTYIEDDALAGTDFIFNFDVISTNLNTTDYTYEAFIKVFSPDYSSVVTVATNPLTSSGLVQLSHSSTDSSAGDHIQYGFNVVGVNINADSSFDADYAAKGSIVIGPNPTLSVENFNTIEYGVFPNPTKNTWNITATQIVSAIEIYDILGKQVLTLSPNTSEVKIDASTLNSGLYLAKVATNSGVKTIKLVKQ